VTLMLAIELGYISLFSCINIVKDYYYYNKFSQACLGHIDLYGQIIQFVKQELEGCN
jgi:hypothetical protein